MTLDALLQLVEQRKQILTQHSLVLSELEQTVQEQGTLIQEREGNLKELTKLNEEHAEQLEEMDRVLDINLKGIFLASKYAVPEIRKRGGGSYMKRGGRAEL